MLLTRSSRYKVRPSHLAPPPKTSSTKIAPCRTMDAFREISSSLRTALCLFLRQGLENVQRYQQFDRCSLAQKAVNRVTTAPLTPLFTKERSK